jgi:hypothetical protein
MLGKKIPSEMKNSQDDSPPFDCFSENMTVQRDFSKLPSKKR